MCFDHQSSCLYTCLNEGREGHMIYEYVWLHESIKKWPAQAAAAGVKEEILMEFYNFSMLLELVT